MSTETGRHGSFAEMEAHKLRTNVIKESWNSTVKTRLRHVHVSFIYIYNILNIYY